jgi:8-oxo-dGTP pyrophosphatase MutT (NUDIX family)
MPISTAARSTISAPPPRGSALAPEVTQRLYHYGGAMPGRRHRPNARVILLDQSGRVLLMHVDDPTDDQPAFWITPGGGFETGESPADAAVRELMEETGLATSTGALASPVARSEGSWEFRGEALYSVSHHFFLRTDAFELNDQNWTDEEREFHQGWRWWSADELDATDDIIYPVGLAGLVRMLHRGERPEPPLELPFSYE